MRTHDPSLSVIQKAVMVLGTEISRKCKNIPGEIFGELMEWVLDIQEKKDIFRFRENDA
jgi:hypothetical protein